MEIKKEELDIASNIISARLSHSQLDELLNRYLPPQLLPMGNNHIKGTKYQKASLLVESRGSELLSDSSLRKYLVSGDPGIATILSNKKNESLININDVTIRSWHPGKKSALQFTIQMGFPQIFAGVESTSRYAHLVEIQPQQKIPKLLDFQEDVVAQILNTLQNNKNYVGMVSLPTGAGKTRVAMEAIIRYQNIHSKGIIIWLATTGEICEQACQTFLKLRNSLPPNEPCQLHRFWGNYEFDFKFESGLMVASVQKLRSYIDSESIPYSLLKRLQAVFFDEGHHAIAPTYDRTISYLQQSGDGKIIPLIGLTATPGRGSDPFSKTSKRLSKRFDYNLITPDGKEWKDPVKHLQDKGILCKAENVVIRTKRKYNLTKKMEEYWQEFKDFSPEFLKKISQDIVRNAIIVEQICKFTNDKKGIVFACSVEHAEYLAFLLRRAGRPAAVVSSETRSAIREQNLDLFKEGKIDFITNFGILTTGFDEPSVEAIVLARPVVSQVLYEQMVGRGLRGTMFGGTDKCIILDFEDNIEGHGRPLAYRRFRNLWAV